MVLQRINGVAMQKEGVVLVWSQEMKRDSLKNRMISAETGIPFRRIKMKNLNQKEQKLVDMTYDNFEHLPIFMQDSSGVTIDKINWPKLENQYLKQKVSQLEARLNAA